MDTIELDTRKLLGLRICGENLTAARSAKIGKIAKMVVPPSIGLKEGPKLED